MSNIHPTAIIDSNAKIDVSVKIGAYSIIGPNVVIGANTTIASHVEIKGHTTIGENNKIYQFTSIGEKPQHTKYNDEPTQLVIGNNNLIREFCTMHLGTTIGDGVTRIGNDNMFMVSTHIAHDCQVGNKTIFANNVALGGHVHVNDWVVLGAYSIVHQFSIIGEHVMVSGATGVAQDVPPYTMAFGYRAEPKGINSEGIKRRGFTPDQIENIKKAYKILYRNGLSLNEAKEKIAQLALTQPELQVYVKFFAQSQRSIIR
jgi:UDP-N-acetylglucosamine acyltransferase